MRRIVLICMAALAAALAACADGSGPDTGAVDFEIRFQGSGATATTDCQVALVSTAHVTFSDGVSTELTIPCQPGARTHVSLVPSTYDVLVQGLNAQMAVCYQGMTSVTVQGGQALAMTLVAQQDPAGSQAGCQYPPPAGRMGSSGTRHGPGGESVGESVP